MSMHIAAQPGEIAERVLIPGDPLRARHIAEHFLDGAKEYNHIRNMLGYTGTYKGVPVSVQGSGMGMPSMAIYATELIAEYGVKQLFRIGTCGALQEDIRIRDLVVAQASTTDSNMPHNTFGHGINFAPTADFSLLEKAVAAARAMNLRCHVGNVLSQDRLYDDEIDLHKLAAYGILAAEMEATALYLAAAKHHVKALALFTVSNHLLTGASTSPDERETSFDDMARVALEAAIRE